MSIFEAAAELLDPSTPEGAFLWYCGIDGCDGLPHEGMEYKHARASQQPPSADFYLWLLLCGRGYGKTRTGAEWLTDKMKNRPNTYWALVAPTFDDGRDTMVEGESGLQFVLDRHKIRHVWNRSLGQLSLYNDARLDLFSSEKPESLRGPNLSGAWGDEPASWSNPALTWKNLQLMTRKDEPQIVLTGTPTPSKFVNDLKNEADFVTRGSSYENQSNLAVRWFEKVVKPMEGTRLGRQEIHGEILADTEGALWVSEQIDHGRLEVPKRFERIVVSLDPSVSAKKRDECGITVGGIARVKGTIHGWLLADYSLQAAPEAWATETVRVYDEWEADAVVAEINNGGDLVVSTLKVVNPLVRVKTVHASRGKIPRAEPVAAMYGDPTNSETWNRAVIHHTKGTDFRLLEDEQTTYVQGDKESPNRMDSLVWLFSDLFGIKQTGKSRGGLRFRK